MALQMHLCTEPRELNDHVSPSSGIELKSTKMLETLKNHVVRLFCFLNKRSLDDNIIRCIVNCLFYDVQSY